MMLEQHIRGSRPSDYTNSELWRKHLLVLFIGILLLGAVVPMSRGQFIQVRMTPVVKDPIVQHPLADSLVTSTGSNEKQSAEYLTAQVNHLIFRELYASPFIAVTHLTSTRLELLEKNRSR